MPQVARTYLCTRNLSDSPIKELFSTHYFRDAQTDQSRRNFLFCPQSAAKVQQNSETTKDKGQKRALERESRVRQSLMEGKLLWKRAEIASDYSDLNQGLYKQPGMLSEPAVQVSVY